MSTECATATTAQCFFVLLKIQFVLLGFERGLVLDEISLFYFFRFSEKIKNILDEKMKLAKTSNNGVGALAI